MKTIMTAGKGGTGKSVMLANLLTQHILLQPNGNTLVVDADPHQSLTQLLARQYHFQIPVSLGELRQQHTDALRSGKGLELASRSELADLIVQQALVPLPGGALLVMGANDQKGCQCVVNSLLGKALDALRDRFELAVVDNEAGIEQIGRHGWAVDILLLMTTMRELDLDVAGRILLHAQAVQREIGLSILIVNHVQVRFDSGRDHSLPKTDYVMMMPYSKSLERTEVPDPQWLASLPLLWDAIRDNEKPAAIVSRAHEK
jgi:CO dehydrogenase nickel-insertion accessory protein CooC1